MRGEREDEGREREDEGGEREDEGGEREDEGGEREDEGGEREDKGEGGREGGEGGREGVLAGPSSRTFFQGPTPRLTWSRTTTSHPTSLQQTCAHTLSGGVTTQSR